MSPLEYLTDAPHRCTTDDPNILAFKEAATIIGGHIAVEEFLACDIWPLNDSWAFKVEKMESLISKVVVLIPKVTAIIGKQEAGRPSTANQLVGNSSSEHAHV
jgi:hypothetical protein